MIVFYKSRTVTLTLGPPRPPAYCSVLLGVGGGAVQREGLT